VYCGYNKENDITRITLTEDQVLEEVKVLKQYGFEHLLLVTGDKN